jgi:murein DD-endopeptidase MepM/ murein hydrolase activator NlpD
VARAPLELTGSGEIVPSASPGMMPRTAIRMVIALCALVLLADIAGPEPTQALTPLGSQISSGRRSQAYYESAMLAQDAAVARIKAQTRQTRRALKVAQRSLKGATARYRQRVRTVAVRQARLADMEARYAGTPPEEIPEWYLDRRREVRREMGTAVRHRKAAARQLRRAQRVRRARQSRLGSLKRQRRASVARREGAEGGLAAYIVRLTGLAQQRAEARSHAQLAMGATFAWPAVGRLSQTYGCTGFRLNPRRGSCRHFHDGLDIVAGSGSPIRAAADGVVAFAGWNPWDEGGRAWIMVVSHPDGYVTRYGHLLPGARVRVGQFVRQGQAIGRMGSTGKSLGTHLHFELLRGGSTQNPLAYLPAGMVSPKVSRGPGHRSGKATHRKHRAGSKRARRADRRDQRRERRQRAAAKAAQATDAMAVGTAPGAGFTRSATLLVEESLTDAATIVCQVIEDSRRADPGTVTTSPDDAARRAAISAGALDQGVVDPCDAVNEAPSGLVGASTGRQRMVASSVALGEAPIRGTVTLPRLE